ncbi:hypothetical protein [Desertivirga arenae]|uniref:hypothetical protein n=1 Tax=Desertivirga arenae TaxID=2810309 RepID=UPI001A96AF60|nr:hypothetical protein [Pedobacter sp. SYSU D00823]
MYDFFQVRFYLTSIFAKNLRCNKWLNWCNEKRFRDSETGKEVERVSAVHHGITFELVYHSDHPDKPMLFLYGSIHIYRNKGGSNNDRFSLSDAIESFYNLFSKFQLDIRAGELQKIEIGVNTFLDFDPNEDLFRRFIVYNGSGGSKQIRSIKDAERKQLGEGIEFNPSAQYRIKAYRKGYRILRIEAHVSVIQKIASICGKSILGLLKLNSVQWLTQMLLLEQIDKMLINEDVTKDGKSERDYEKYLQAMTPRTWLDLNPNNNSSDEEKKRFKTRKNALKRWTLRYQKDNAGHYMGEILKEAIIKELNCCCSITEEAAIKLALLESGEYLNQQTGQNNYQQPNYNSIEANLVDHPSSIQTPSDNNDFQNIYDPKQVIKEKTFIIPKKEISKNYYTPLKPQTRKRRYGNRKVELSNNFFDFVDTVKSKLTPYESYQLEVYRKHFLMYEDKDAKAQFYF